MSWHIFWNLLDVFVVRHCVLAFANAGLTSLLGLVLLRGVERFRWPRLSTFILLHLRRLVILGSLAKGTFYLVRGTAVRNMSASPWALGIQFPSPDQWIGLAPMSTLNVWKPTTATGWVTVILIGVGMILLFWRLRQLICSQRHLRNLIQFASVSATPRVEALLQQAADAMDWPRRYPLPHVILADLPYPTPLLLGLRRPLLLLSMDLASSMSDLELEMALRHELAHCLRRDQWWRWLQTWLEDVGRLNGLSRPLGTRALVLEEEICDRMAAHTALEARALGRAIYKATQAVVGPSGTAPTLPDDVVPALLGWRTRNWNEPGLLSARLRAIVGIADEMSVGTPGEKTVAAKTAQRHRRSWRMLLQRTAFAVSQIIGCALLGLVLAVILYVKFNIVIGH